MVKDCVFGNGSAVLEAGYLGHEKNFGKWHRSKERKATSFLNLASFHLNKKWVLEEEFNNHILRFQQVKLRFVLQCFKDN